MENYTLYAGLSRAVKSWQPICLLIRWAEAPTFFSLFDSSHVFTVYPAHVGRPFYLVNEAAGSMIRWVSEPHFQRHSEITHLYKFKMPRDAYHRIKGFGELYAGAPYATMENLGILVVRLFKLLGMRIKNPFARGAKAQKCSELVMRTVMLEYFALTFGPDFNLKMLQMNVVNDRGYALPLDLDLFGVADLFEVFEWLKDGGYIEKINVSHEMKIAA